MNWRFWTWHRLEDENLRLREKCEQWLAAALQGDAELMAAKKSLAAVRAALKFKERPAGDQPDEGQILSALALVEEGTPLWRAVHRLLDAMDSDQKSAVCQAGLNAEERAFNAGRLSMVEDMRVALLSKWAEARRSNAEAQN